MQSNSLPQKFQLPFASTGQKNTIPVASQAGITPGAASLTDGFPAVTMIPVAAGGVPPFGQDFNGILNAITAIQQWQNAGGLFTFDAVFAAAIQGYPKGAVLMRADLSGLWLNTVDGQLTDPDSSATNGWISIRPNSGMTTLAVATGLNTPTNSQIGVQLIVCTGAPSGTATLVLPLNAGAKWIVVNQLTAGALAVQGATGAPVSLSAGASIVYTDGVNFYAISGAGSGGGTSTSQATYGATNISPADGSSGVASSPVLTGDTYYPLFGVPQAERDFQLIQGGGNFNAPYYSGTATPSGGVAAVSLTVGVSLPSGPYQWRYRDKTAKGDYGPWSAPTAFTTTSQNVVTPSVTSPAANATGVGSQPTITISAFAVSSGSDTLRATSLIIRDSANNIVYQFDQSTTQLNNIVIPAGVLQAGQKTYTVSVRYWGTTYGASAWSAPQSFTTAQYFSLTGNYSQWSSGATPRSNATLTALNNKLYMFGGNIGQYNTHYGDLWVYDPTTNNQWTQLASGPAARSYHSMVAINGKLYLFGGRDGASPANAYNDVWCYDPTVDTWTQLTPTGTTPIPRYNHIGVAINGKMYITGGEGTTSGEFWNETHVYDPVANSWTALATGQMRAGGYGVACGTKMYCFSGVDSSNTLRLDITAYDTVANTWATLATSTAGNSSSGRACGCVGTNLYFYSVSSSSSGGYPNGLLQFDTVANTFTQLTAGPAATARVGEAADVLNGAMWFFGGNHSTGYLNDLWKIS